MYFFFINTSLAYCDSGAKHLFIHKGILVAKPPQESTNAEEECIEHAINAGAEEVETKGDDLEPGYYKVNSLNLLFDKYIGTMCVQVKILFNYKFVYDKSMFRTRVQF